ncbi:GNAT family N-acetyltransferase [Bradyrhizobium sp. 2TAF24]|uniref:GNAT family N-acetyltransferase n=1 Tax=Bradyrhizobium sp. 2TAF24 TaxID=3233011 RepID=UPI003F9193FF
MNPVIEVSVVVDAAAMQAIGGGLARFNAAAAGYGDQRALAVVVRDPVSGQPAGGATGRSSFGLLFLDLLFLPNVLRGRGIGAEVLRRFEDEGRRRGCRAAVLYTISFQAPDFYARHGWRRFGEIACDPPGTSRIFMTKSLREE